MPGIVNVQPKPVETTEPDEVEVETRPATEEVAATTTTTPTRPTQAELRAKVKKLTIEELRKREFSNPVLAECQNCHASITFITSLFPDPKDGTHHKYPADVFEDEKGTLQVMAKGGHNCPNRPKQNPASSGRGYFPSN